MWYLVEILLYKWLITDILGQPWIFWTAVALAIAVFLAKAVTDAEV
jgi:hypothetical protein